MAARARAAPTGTRPSRRWEPVGYSVARDTGRLVYAGASMSPTLRESQLLHVRPYRTKRVRPGDVVCFKSPDGCVTIVHRVVAVGPDGIRTRGDNSRSDDPQVLSAAKIIGRVVAAQSGRRVRKIHGGRAGTMLLRWRGLGRGIARLAGPAPHTLYNIAIGLGPRDRLLPRRFRPRIVRFGAPQGQVLKLLVGRRTVGQYDYGRGQWSIRRPYRLFMNEHGLERAVVAADIHQDARQVR